MKLAERFVPLNDEEMHLLSVFDTLLDPKLVLHRGHNSVVLVEQDEVESVVKLPRYGFYDIHKLTQQNDHTKLLAEARVLHKLQDLSHIVKLESTYVGFTNWKSFKGGKTLNQSIAQVTKIPANTLYVTMGTFHDIIRMFCDDTSYFFRDRMVKKVAGFKTEKIDGASVGSILYEPNPFQHSKVEVFQPDLDWKCDDNAIYHQDRKIATKCDILHQLDPIIREIHEREIACIDICPNNVLVSKNGEAYLFDFDRVYKSGMLKDKARWQRSVIADMKDLENLFNPTHNSQADELTYLHSYG
jgi:serine/threonine protein kinase